MFVEGSKTASNFDDALVGGKTSVVGFMGIEEREEERYRLTCLVGRDRWRKTKKRRGFSGNNVVVACVGIVYGEEMRN